MQLNRTALMMAANKGHTAYCQKLLEAKADMSMKDKVCIRRLTQLSLL